ncbi:splicing factor YJU2 [Caerostris extrusa]|uniref:Splicing factor YJU2 n=1 Tax=Caerostris extrusa TaxID=172846 RepID=A0AAV4RUK3_CAEEX|nr:splicing factor YJU2 [Caerostris extrusa]
MSERKVLNKYYPPDFDPSKIPRLRLPRDRQYTVRLMAPCNMRCTTCGEYIYKGKKFNARKETVQNEEYLGIKIFRFYIKCPCCLAEITFKTDPENADYIVEHGATRNFQALKLAEEAAAKQAKELEEEEKNNPMKLLENRTQASKREMEVMETLEELKDLNQRHSKVDIQKLLVNKQQQLIDEIKQQEEEDEAFYKNPYVSKPLAIIFVCNNFTEKIFDQFENCSLKLALCSRYLLSIALRAYPFVYIRPICTMNLVCSSIPHIP